MIDDEFRLSIEREYLMGEDHNFLGCKIYPLCLIKISTVCCIARFHSFFVFVVCSVNLVASVVLPQLCQSPLSVFFFFFEKLLFPAHADCISV